jgi:Trk K+ transport system NAD-binding subunit
MEQRVQPGSSVAGKKLRDAGLPSGCVVIWVQHQGMRSFATGSTEIYEGDLMNVIISANQADEFRRILGGIKDP